MTIAAEFAKNRYTLGVPISTLQGISHPLANIAITVQGGRNLARRAAWFLDNEPDERPELAPSAFVFMAEEAAKAATMAVHVQGGLGVSAEAAATAYLVRARGWALAGGDPGATAKYIAAIVAARESSRTELSHGLLTGAAVRRRPGVPRRGPSLPRRTVTEDVLRRDRETGDNFDEGVHLALGAAGYLARRMEAGVRRRLHPGAAADLGAGEAPRACAVGDVGHHGDGRQVGGEVRFTRTQGRSATPGVQRPRAAVPGLHRARGRLRRRHVQDPRGARRRRAGSSTAPRCSPPARTTASTSS